LHFKIDEVLVLRKSAVVKFYLSVTQKKLRTTGARNKTLLSAHWVIIAYAWLDISVQTFHISREKQCKIWYPSRKT